MRKLAVLITTISLVVQVGHAQLVIDRIGNLQSFRGAYAQGILSTSDGGYLLASLAATLGSNEILRCDKLNQNLESEWMCTCSESGESRFGSVYEVEDGYLIGGYIIIGDFIPTIVKIDLNGDARWQRFYTPSTRNSICYDLLQTVDGNFALVGWGRIQGETTRQAWIMKLDEEFEESWFRHYTEFGALECEAATVTQDGGFLLACRGDSLRVLKTDESGEPVWLQTYPHPDAFEIIDISRVSETPERYSITGKISGGSLVIVIDSDGNEMWSNLRTVETGDVYGTSSVSTQNDEVLVMSNHVMYLDTIALCDIIIDAYTLDGILNWSYVYDDTLYQSGRGMVVEPNGDLFVFGARSMVYNYWNDHYMHEPFWAVFGQTTSVQPSYSIADNITLHPSYPNPFNPTATIRFDLPVASEVSLTVYNLQGQTVETLVNGQMLPGSHAMTFDGSRFSSGSYFYTLKANDFIETRQMLLVK